MTRLLVPFALLAAPAIAQTEEPTACMDALRGVMLAAGGQSAAEVVSSSFSEAGTTVYLRDGGQTLWRCTAAGGTVEELAVVMDADERDEVLNAPPAAAPESVEFADGEASATLEREVEAGGTMQFALAADGVQTLSVEVVSDAPGYFYVRGPVDTVIHDPVDVGDSLSAELPMGGEYIVELVSAADAPATFTVTVAIE
ncbi:hypothetical protein GCM10011392_30690 [Wenxinia marina]|nr:hypothetical protein GCM10011392_30690 [Wenxinia marina]